MIKKMRYTIYHKLIENMSGLSQIKQETLTGKHKLWFASWLNDGLLEHQDRRDLEQGIRIHLLKAGVTEEDAIDFGFATINEDQCRELESIAPQVDEILKTLKGWGIPLSKEQ